LTLAMIAVASTSYAGLLVDLRPVAGTGYTVLGDGKTVSFSAPGVFNVNYELWGVMTGTDGTLTNDGLQTVTGGVENVPLVGPSINKFTAFTIANYVAPFTASTGAISRTDNLIGTKGATTTTNAIVAGAPTPMPMNTASVNSYKLAAFTSEATVSGLNGQPFASVNYVKAGNGIPTYTFMMDGTPRNGMAAGNALVTVGAPVQLVGEVPEPGTFVLLGAGVFGVGLMLWRRKRA
jgi:hypothetical protein